MSAPQNMLQIVDVSGLEALRRFAVSQGLKGKDLIEVLRKQMRYIVSFAINKIPKGDPAKIRASLTQVITNYSRISARNVRTGALADKWRGTLAAKLVFMLNWQDAKLAGAFGDIDAAYRKAALFTSRRVFAANLHRAGLREAITKLRAGSGSGRLPKFKNQPGSYNENLADNIVSIIVENWARAAGKKSKGITGLAGDAFDRAIPEVERLFAGFDAKDSLGGAVRKAAVREGFKVSAA